MLHHADIWRAIDRLAERHHLSPSGLARKAGLSATSFNPSKRSNGSRKRWPSTESIAAILKATGSSLDDFVALASAQAPQRHRIPLLDCAMAKKEGSFDETGRPTGPAWDSAPWPGSDDPDAFILELSERTAHQAFPEGTRLLFSPAEKPRRGDLVGLRTVQGEILIKKLGREGAQKIELHASSGDEPPLTLPRHDVDWLYRIAWVGR